MDGKQRMKAPKPGEPGKTETTGKTENREVQKQLPALQSGPIVFFDGVCNICNHSVNTLLKLDRKGKLRYASLQGELAASLFGQLQGDPDSMKLSLPAKSTKGPTQSTGPGSAQDAWPGEPESDEKNARVSVRGKDAVRLFEGFDAFLKVGGILYPVLAPLAFLLSLPPLVWAGRAFYRWIARNRYRWFGKREFCDISHLKFKDRFLN